MRVRLLRWWLPFLAMLLVFAVLSMMRADDKATPSAAPVASAAGADVKKDAPAAAATKEEGRAGATPNAPAPAAPAAAPSLPPYFSPGNDDLKKGTWPDPNGGNAATWATPSGALDKDNKPAGDVPADMKPTDLYDRIVHNLFSINMVWAMVTGFLVMFMQAGFALVETGLCRAKNAGHTMTMNFLIYPLGCIAFWAYGFALGWGNWNNGPVAPGWYSALGPGTAVLNSGTGIGPAYEKDAKGNDDPSKPTGAYKYGLLGTKGFCLNGVDDVSVMALFFFMMVFMDTTATIPTGAMAERWAFKNFLIYGLWVALPYCIYANWVWGGGFLAQAGVNWNLGHGSVDFAGSGVVHAMGGVIGLVGAWVLGSRIGKYKDGKTIPIPAHHLPMVMVGTFILAFGWFGFNPGSTLSGTDLRISVVVVNTMLAGTAGSLGAMLTLFAKKLKADPSMLCNGMLAGLVAITAPCAFVDSWAAVVIGGLAGVFVVFSVFFWDKLQIDDPVGAISVHGVNGLWGVLSVGIFANGKYGGGWNGVVRDEFMKKFTAEHPGLTAMDGVLGILFGDASQLYAQALDCLVLVVFGGIMAYVWFKISNLITPIRVPKEVEVEGLDLPEVGAMGYPEFVVTSRN
jgi:ammonium transporter, Amt family